MAGGSNQIDGKNILCPAKLAGHADIELPFQVILAFFHNDQIMRPTDFCNQ